MKIVSMTAVVLTALVLVACGGGGGGEVVAVDQAVPPVVAPPGAVDPAVPPVVVPPGNVGPVVPPVVVPPVVVPPAPVVTGSITSAAGCVIANGAATCNAMISYTSSNTSAPALKVGADVVSNSAVGVNFSTPIGVGVFAVTLSDGATVLATSSVTGACNAGYSIVGGVCAVPTYNYDRLTLVVFADQGGTIGVINPDNTVTPLINSTGFTTGAVFPIALCGIYDKLLADGRPLATCVTPGAGNTRRNFPINPLTNELTSEYTGAVPAGAVAHDVGYGVFGATPYAAFDVSSLGEFVDVPTVGTYYFTDFDSVNLRFTDDGFATNTIVHVGDHQYLANFSNP